MKSVTAKKPATSQGAGFFILVFRRPVIDLCGPVIICLGVWLFAFSDWCRDCN